MSNILVAKNLTKRFGDFMAVDNISFSLCEGEILGLLGPNGAGKTTTIQMLLGVLTQTKGEVFFFGKNLKTEREAILEKVNFSSTYTNLPWDLTVWENLHFASYLYGIKNRKQKISELLDVFRIKDLQKDRLSSLSSGQLTRVNLAKAFLNSPKVLLLDEPTASLDPDVANYIRQFLLEERQKFQVSIIFTSHNMAEVEEVCDRVIFIDKGKIVANDTPENLAKTIEVCHVELHTKNLAQLRQYCSEKNLPLKSQGRYAMVDVKEKRIPEFLRELSSNNIVYDEISIDKPTLEDFFIQNALKL